MNKNFTENFEYITQATIQEEVKTFDIGRIEKIYNQEGRADIIISDNIKISDVRILKPYGVVFETFQPIQEKDFVLVFFTKIGIQNILEQPSITESDKFSSGFTNLSNCVALPFSILGKTINSKLGFSTQSSEIYIDSTTGKISIKGKGINVITQTIDTITQLRTALTTIQTAFQGLASATSFPQINSASATVPPAIASLLQELLQIQSNLTNVNDS